MTDSPPVLDLWARWLLERRHGGDPESLRRTLEHLAPVRDRVLKNAEVREGDVLLDVGCGDGLIGFGGLALVGATGRVIFSDISVDLLRHVESLAKDDGVAERCGFVRADAADLTPIVDRSVDVLTTRSVLIYVREKAAAFRAFHRVLREGGRFSLFEPINSFTPRERQWFGSLDLEAVHAPAQKLVDLYRRLQPDDDPMLDFDERDLLAFAEGAGFTDIHLELQAALEQPRHPPPKWETFVRRSWNPKVPTLEEAMGDVLTAQERDRFVSHVRPQIESGRQRPVPWAVAYLWGRR